MRNPGYLGKYIGDAPIAHVKTAYPAYLGNYLPVLNALSLNGFSDELYPPFKIGVRTLLFHPGQGRQHHLCIPGSFGKEPVLDDKKFNIPEGLSHIVCIRETQ